MKYIIMAGGDYTYLWQKPKQLTKICGEPLIARTIRLLKESGVQDINISSNNPVFEQFGVPVLHHNNDFKTYGEECKGYWVDCFYPTDEPCTYLYGDVVYSPEAIKTIVEYETDDVMLFGGRKPFAPEYPKEWREPFGFKVVNQKHFRDAITETKALADMGAFCRHPISWQLWGVIRSTSWKLRTQGYVVINDYTCDIDSPKDIKRYEKILGGK